MEDIQNLKNKLSLLVECVNFYADDENHKKNQNNNTQSLFELDGGHIARQTLKLVGKLESYEIEIDQLSETLEEMDSPDEILKKINEIIKKIDE